MLNSTRGGTAPVPGSLPLSVVEAARSRNSPQSPLPRTCYQRSIARPTHVSCAHQEEAPDASRTCGSSIQSSRNTLPRTRPRTEADTATPVPEGFTSAPWSTSGIVRRPSRTPRTANQDREKRKERAVTHAICWKSSLRIASLSALGTPMIRRVKPVRIGTPNAAVRSTSWPHAPRGSCIWIPGVRVRSRGPTHQGSHTRSSIP